MILALALAAAVTGSVSAKVDAVAAQAKLAGVVLVARGDRVLVEKGYGTVDPSGGRRHDPKMRWRLAPITKQVTATLVMRGHAGQLDMPWPQAMGLPADAQPTIRQLLTHHSGLFNPDTSPPGAGGVPSFYLARSPDALPVTTACTAVVGSAGGPFSYNNCDYIVARTLLGFAGGEPERFWPAGMAMAKPGEMGVPGFVAGQREPHYELARFGAAGGLIGTVRSVFAFDRALMTGTLLAPAARAELWKPEGGRSYQALGQWVFPGKLAGCAAARRIVQRDGEIGGVQTRNYILPDDDMIVVVFTNRSSDDFPIGEIWQGKGFAYDLLSAAACGSAS